MLIGHINAAADVRGYLDGGAVVVTATPQLAGDWKRRLLAEESVSETPYACCWRQWLETLAGSRPAIPVAYNSLQELELWQRVIRSDVSGLSTASVRGLAGHAAGAYALLREYRIDPDDIAGGGEEAESFLRWMRQFEKLCRENGRMASADIGEWLLPTIDSRMAVGHILLDGFDELTPLQQAILQQLEEKGSRISVLDHAKAAAKVTLNSLADVEDEYRYMAATLRTLLDENPQQRIAIVTAAQTVDSAMLRRCLDEVLLPADTARLPTAEQAVHMPGDPLAGMPLVRQLLQLLQLAGSSGATFEDFSRLLLSPLLGGFESERRGRAQLDAWLRENNRHYLSFHALLAMEQLQDLPRLSAIIRALQVWNRAARCAASWVKAVHALLQACGCMEVNRGRSPVEVRQLNGFRDALSSLIAIDAVSGDVEWSELLLLLRERLSATPFALPVRFPQVTVMPLSVISGMRFDVVLAIGFDEDALPVPVTVQPLLPPAAVRKYRLPQATPELAFAASGFLLDQLRQAAARLYISYARQRDERELAVSPLLADLPEQRPKVGVVPFRQFPMQPFVDAPAVPLAVGERVHGGAVIMKNQSACPFRAFATHRLGITPLEETAPGLAAATRGSLVHLALERIWQQLGSQQALLQLGDAATAVLIDSAVDHAMRACRMVMADASREIERQRLRRLLDAWLQFERERPPFEVVGREKEFNLQLPASGNLRFPVRLQVDRIDRDTEGRTILIDYKTGRKLSPGRWMGERMAEPQLPLYAVAAQLGERDAVCFARVRSGDMAFEGLSGEATGIVGLTICKGGEEAAAGWRELLDQWRQRIDVLAAEFVEGRSEVAPRDTHACDYCGLEAVCRVDETGFDSEAGEEEA